MGARSHDLHPEMRRAIAELLRHDTRAIVTSTYRSVADQSALYQRRERNAYPVAPPGRSSHHTGLAADVSARTPQQQMRLGRLWREWGGRWSESDRVHFEHPDAQNALRAGLVSRRWWNQRRMI